MAKKTSLKYPDKFTENNIIGYVAQKNELSKKMMKDIFEDIFDVINTGLQSGNRVPVGKFGKAYVRVRPPSKAREGINPLTKEKIMIKAKPATKVPKFSFSKNFKETCKKAKLKK